MEKFLEVVYKNQLSSSEKGDEFYKIFTPMLEELKQLLSEKLYRDIEELFIDCAVSCCEFYAVEGMKLAIGIMDGTYIPRG